MTAWLLFMYLGYGCNAHCSVAVPGLESEAECRALAPKLQTYPDDELLKQVRCIPYRRAQ
jgi:hypothetical protein